MLASVIVNKFTTQETKVLMRMGVDSVVFGEFLVSFLDINLGHSFDALRKRILH